MQSQSRPRQLRGFTLVELAIVLAVIGLIIGAVAIAKDVQRNAEYQKVAKDNGIALGDVEAIAGKKALERTPKGQFIQLNGQWVQK